jgi:microcompartment protein CcmK/EutM
MSATYEPIATTTLGSATNSVTFSSIPATYTDLVIVTDFTVTVNNQAAHYVQINGDTGNNYSRTILYGTGSAAGSARQSNNSSLYFGMWVEDMDTTDRSVISIYFNNYSNSTTFKTGLGRYSVATKEVGAGVGTWRNTAAITSLNLAIVSNNYAVGSTFTLYGIKAA